MMPIADSTLLFSILMVILAMYYSTDDGPLVSSKIVSYIFTSNKTLFAKIGMLLSMRVIFVYIFRPLYKVFKRRNSSNVASRYGSWCLLIIDDSKSIPLLKKFAQFLINEGVNILILDNLSRAEHMKIEDHRDIESLVKDLKLYASANDVLSVEATLKVKIETVRGDYNDNELSELSSRIGEIMTDGGLGVVLNFTSSLSVAESNAKKFLDVMHTILPYYLFRRTGAVINITDLRSDGDANGRGGLSTWIQRGISRGVSGFATQLTRSIHFELIGYGVHSIAVTIRQEESISADTIVKTTFQSLGHEEELDFNFVRMTGYIDMLI
jgi:hypothetical protein